MTKIMGILNLTPDSFFDGGRYLKEEVALEKAKDLIRDGADIVDLGGESSRPGSQGITLEEEQKRVLPVLGKIRQSFPQQEISIDTTKSKLAQKAITLGAKIINDISAGRDDPDMLSVIRQSQAGFVLMHVQGEPKTMQRNPGYVNVIDEINSFFEGRIKKCLDAGIDKDRLILDPGIGFGKNAEHNYTIIANLEKFRRHRIPLMIGLSMKSLLEGEPADRLPGTIALNCVAMLKGVSIVRVHHVKEAKLSLQAIRNVLEKTANG